MYTSPLLVVHSIDKKFFPNCISMDTDVVHEVNMQDKFIPNIYIAAGAASVRGQVLLKCLT